MQCHDETWSSHCAIMNQWQFILVIYYSITNVWWYQVSMWYTSQIEGIFNWLPQCILKSNWRHFHAYPSPPYRSPSSPGPSSAQIREQNPPDHHWPPVPLHLPPLVSSWLQITNLAFHPAASCSTVDWLRWSPPGAQLLVFWNSPPGPPQKLLTFFFTNCTSLH